MTNLEVLELMNSFKEFENIENIKLAYAITRNKRKIETLLEDIRKTLDIQPVEKENDFHQKRNELNKEYFDFYENGQVKGYKEGKTGEQFEKDVIELEEEYQDVIKKLNENQKKENEILSEEADIELYKVMIDNLPEDFTANQLEKLFLIIDEC